MKIAVILATLFLSALTSAQAPGTHEPRIRLSGIRFAGVTQLEPRDQESCAAQLQAQTYVRDRWLEKVAEQARVGCWQMHGYYRAQVRARAEESTHDAQSVVLTVREGPQYRLGLITIAGNRVVDTDLLVSVVPFRPGEVFDSEKIKEGVDNLRKAYADIGYLEFSSHLTPEVDDERHVVEINWDLREGRPFFVRTIQFEGASPAMEDALRSQLLLKSGSVYSEGAMQKSLDKMRKMLPPLAGLDAELSYDNERGVVEVRIVQGASGNR